MNENVGAGTAEDNTRNHLLVAGDQFQVNLVVQRSRSSQAVYNAWASEVALAYMVVQCWWY